jgi:activating signal cointegrator 1
MKAISLWQPWASLWCSGIKIHETRHRPTSHRGWLVVHAAKRRIDDLDGDRLGDICNSVFGHHYGQDLPRGAIVGRVYLIACKPTYVFPADFAGTEDYECGDFSDGRFAWQADKFEAFTSPIPYRGQQGMFDVPDDILPRVAA